MPVPVDLSKSSDVVKNDVVKKTDYNAKITKIENKIPDINNSATKTALNTVERKKNLILLVLLKRQIIILK